MDVFTTRGSSAGKDTGFMFKGSTVRVPSLDTDG